MDYEVRKDRPWRTLFRVRIDLGSGLSSRERKMLFHVARSCEVHKMLIGEISCDYQLTDDGP